MEQEGQGLRERKKLRTRETIVSEALRLFDERGFDQTTIAEIAEAADISPRTFFAYFPSKEDVVFHDYEETFEAFEARLRDRGTDETAIDAMRAWILEYAAPQRIDERAICRHRVVEAAPSLLEHQRGRLGRFERVLAEAVAVDLGEQPAAPRPAMVAAAAMAALESLGDRSGKKSAMRANDESVAMLDEALVFLRGGIAALRENGPTVGEPR